MRSSIFPTVFLAFSSISIVHTAPINSTQTDCPIEKVEKIGDCLKDLISTVESITKWVDQDYKFDQGEKDNFKAKCDDTQKCFSSVKSSCPDFPNEITQELDIMCSRFTFIIDKFTDCVPKLNALTEVSCVDALVGPDSLKKTTSSEKCENIRKNRKCVRKEVEETCGEKMGRVIDENFDYELKLYNCPETI